MLLAVFLPVVQEESVLDQKIKNKINEAFHCHESNIFPHKVPSERVQCVIFTWKQTRSKLKIYYNFQWVKGYFMHRQYRWYNTMLNLAYKIYMSWSWVGDPALCCCYCYYYYYLMFGGILIMYLGLDVSVLWLRVMLPVSSAFFVPSVYTSCFTL